MVADTPSKASLQRSWSRGLGSDRCFCLGAVVRDSNCAGSWGWSVNFLGEKAKKIPEKGTKDVTKWRVLTI